jgi:hypothetical protein
VLPDGRPRRDDEDESSLEKVRREEQSAEGADDQPPACTRARCSTRAATSR